MLSPVVAAPAPLNAMARALASRPASDLSPLPATDNPSEIRPVIRCLNGLFARVDAVREHEWDFTAFAALRENALRQIAICVDRTSRLIRQLDDFTNAEIGEVIQDEGRVNVGKALETLAEDIRQHYPQAVVISVEFALFSVTLPVTADHCSCLQRGIFWKMRFCTLHQIGPSPAGCGASRAFLLSSSMIAGPTSRTMSCQRCATASSGAQQDGNEQRARPCHRHDFRLLFRSASDEFFGSDHLAIEHSERRHDPKQHRRHVIDKCRAPDRSVGIEKGSLTGGADNRALGESAQSFLTFGHREYLALADRLPFAGASGARPRN